LAAFPAFFEQRNSTAVARVTLAVTGALIPIGSSLRQGQAAEENKAQNGNLHHLGIVWVMEARKAGMKNYYKLVEQPGFARDFNCQLCLYVFFLKYLFISLYLCLSSLSLPNPTKP
jgi:hypothetical protein